jgi:prenyltransferase/squalene oxidase-like repeat protein
MGFLNRDAVGEYVLSRRTPSGGYCFYRTPQWGVEEGNAPDTMAALESLRMLGIPPPAPQETVAWLRTLQSVDGGYGTLTIGWAALVALGVLGSEPSRSPRAWLEHWTSMLLASHGPRDWRGTLLGVLRVLELRRAIGLEPDTDQRQAISGLLDAASDGPGRWARPGADLETSAVAVRVIGLARIPRWNEPASRGFLHECEDPVLGVRLAPGAAATSVGALWGGLTIARALGVRLSHPDAIGRSIARLQRPNGGLGARDRAIPTLHDTWLGLRAACILDELQEGHP